MFDLPRVQRIGIVTQAHGAMGLVAVPVVKVLVEEVFAPKLLDGQEESVSCCIVDSTTLLLLDRMLCRQALDTYPLSTFPC